MAERRKGGFIALEGIDGSGKSTQARLLKEALEADGIPCYVTMEPTASPFGKLLRQVLKGELKTDARVVAPLFVADRLDHLVGETEGIARKLEDGITVITDRYYFSSYAYQSVDLPLDWVITANEICAQIRRPDVSIFIDLDPAAAMERIRENRDHVEIFEKRERLEKCRENYFRAFERLKEQENVAVTDGNRGVDEIAAEIYRICRSYV